jgi:hypothetical protein
MRNPFKRWPYNDARSSPVISALVPEGPERPPVTDRQLYSVLIPATAHQPALTEQDHQMGMHSVGVLTDQARALSLARSCGGIVVPLQMTADYRAATDVPAAPVDWAELSAQLKHALRLLEITDPAYRMIGSAAARQIMDAADTIGRVQKVLDTQVPPGVG